MYKYWFINCNQCTALEYGVNNRRNKYCQAQCSLLSFRRALPRPTRPPMTCPFSLQFCVYYYFSPYTVSATMSLLLFLEHAKVVVIDPYIGHFLCLELFRLDLHMCCAFYSGLLPQVRMTFSDHPT